MLLRRITRSMSKSRSRKNSLNEWLKIANVKYDSKKEVKKYQSKVKKYYSNIEQKWVDENLQPIIDLIGDEDIWKCIIPNVELHGLDKRISIKHIKVSNNPQGYYSQQHWYSRKPDEEEWFDSYDNYQVQGTNQFCQTFALLNLLDLLPETQNNDWLKYYDYTKYALDFIETVIKKCLTGSDKKMYLQKVKTCKKYYIICVNSIEFF